MNVVQLLERAHQLNAELRQINDQLKAAPITDLVPLVAEDIRPETIMVWDEGQEEAIVLLRSTKTPEYAFVVLGIKSHGTQWLLSLKLADGGSSRVFALQCGCCSDELIGLKRPEKKEDEDVWEKEQRARFIKKMEVTCLKYDIKTIFVRRANSWKQRYHEMANVQVFEGNQCRDVMAEDYGQKRIAEALSFLGEGTNI